MQFKRAALTLHDFLLVAEPGRVLLLSCEELELISSSSSSSSSKFILLDIPAPMRRVRKTEGVFVVFFVFFLALLLIGIMESVVCGRNVPTSFTVKI